MQPRKYVTIQRSANKDPPRASYDHASYRQTYDTNFYGDLSRYGTSPNILKSRIQKDEPKLKYSQLHKSPSEVGFKSRQQHVKGNLARRRGDGMVSNLKSELQNLKMEVSKLMSKDTDSSKMFTSRRASVKTQEDDIDSDGGFFQGNYVKDISDSISVTSEKIIDEPLRRLQSKFNTANYDHAHYLELQADLLKTQLRNLKNKYNSTKQQWRQKCQALQRKNQYLEISLRRSQQTLAQCKKSLEVQVQTIKFQLTRKLQQQYEQQQSKSSRSIQPVRDNLGQNQFVQEKLNKLYEQLNEKSKMISNMNIDLNEVKGTLQKKIFELKKQTQKNNQLSKQIQFAKKQNSRNKNLLQIQVAKKVELTKTVENLREKVNELSKQLHLKNQIVTGSQELQNKYSLELNQLKDSQEKLSQQNFELQNQVRKLRQLSDSHQQQIKHLKNTINDFTNQVEQISKNLRMQREKSIETEQRYRKMIDETKQAGQKQLQILQQQFDKYRQTSKQIAHQTQVEVQKSRGNFDMKQKDRQISKWKAQYKMLKLKYDEHFALQTSKKEEIQSYYKNYKQYKSKNRILQMRNKVLEQSASDYISKIQAIEAANLEERVQSLQTINQLTLQNQQHQRKIQYIEEELTELRNIVEVQVERANQQQNFRKQIQNKVLNIDLDGNNQIMQVIERMKRRVSDQDDKINKYIKQMKNKDNLIKQLKKQIRSFLENQQKQLQKFRNKQVADCVLQIQNKTFSCLQQLKNQNKKQIQIQTSSNNELIQENAKMKGEIATLTKQLMDLKEQVKTVSHLYNLKTIELQQIIDKNQYETQIFSIKLDEIQKIKNQTIKNLQSEIANKNEQIMNQRAQIKRYLTSKHNLEDQTFDEALKAQIETSKKLRQDLNKKNQQVYRLRDSYSVIKTQLDNLKSQSDIGKLKFISDKKNLQVQYDVEVQNLRNQYSLQQKKVISLQQKIKLVIDENKKKDTFIQSYIMGKKLPTNEKQLVAAFLKQYQICVTGKDISLKLQSESQQLQKMAAYNFSLMKQIAEMKQKLVLYQAISVDNSETRDNYLGDIDTPQKSLIQSQTLSNRRSRD